MDRFLMDNLVEWKNKKNRKPLILKGARQVGKTWLMKRFGEEYFQNMVYINFDKDAELQSLFDKDYDMKRILFELSVFSKERIAPQKTLIILDEIQECPRAISAVKYFCEDAGEYAVIAAGSLLGVSMHSGISFPVGKVNIMQLYPLSFCEFLYATGEKRFADLIRNADFDSMNTFHDKLIEFLKKYYYIGGMPEVVNEFVESGDVIDVREIQNNIIALYEADFSKHTPVNEVPRIRMVWDSIPLQLAKENKKFFFGQMKKGARAKEFELAIEWLADCGLIYKVNRVSKPFVPLKSYQQLESFKIYSLDIGLLGAMSELDMGSIIDGNRIFTEFKGALTEQYVFQQLMAETDYTPYYYSETRSEGEIDFLIQKEGIVVPVEVKAEENLRAKSLKVYCQKFSPDYAVRTSMSGFREQEWLTNIPLYAVENI